MLGLIFGETNFPNEILRKIKKRKLKYLIIDLTKRKKFKKDKYFYSKTLRLGPRPCPRLMPDSGAGEAGRPRNTLSEKVCALQSETDAQSPPRRSARAPSVQAPLRILPAVRTP